MKKIHVALLLSTASIAFMGCAKNADEITGASDEAFTSSQLVTCQSWNYQPATCGVDTHGGSIVGVRVARQLSTTPQGACNEGYSYGIGDGSLWVDHGCRADFEVTVQTGGGNRATISCASNGYQYATCGSPITNINSIRLLHQDSQSACTEGSSYGYYSDSIWVDHGCRGTFEVTSGGGDHGGHGGDITLFEHDNFGGRSLHLTDRTDNFDPIGFNDMVSSLIIRRGTWELCTDAYFQGSCPQYGPGEYRSVGPALNDKFSSARLVGW